jgi:hypothetical protein
MPRRLDHLPTVLARKEVEHLLKAVADLKLRTAPGSRLKLVLVYFPAQN